MLGAETKKKLTIVVDKETMTYGELLLALTLMKDDKQNSDNSENGQIIGTKDGSMDAIVWDEKVYKDNQPQLASSQKIVFIGKMDSAKPILANINCDNAFSKYGIYYGYLGNKAVIYVDKGALTSNKKYYNAFVDDYTNFLSDVETEYSLSQKVEKPNYLSDAIDIKAEKLQNAIDGSVNNYLDVLSKRFFDSNDETTDAASMVPKEEKKENKLAGAVAVAVAGIVTPFEHAAGVRAGLVKAKDNNEIADQQYRCAILAFYINALRSFME